MNKFTRAIILATAAIATIATSMEFAAAGDRDPRWRKHRQHHQFQQRHDFRQRHVFQQRHHFRNRPLVTGVIIRDPIVRPRIIYRPRPIVIQQEPTYVEPETVYVNPDVGYDRPIARYEGPVDDSYNSTDDNYAVDNNDYEDSATAGNDFPEPPVRDTDNRRHQRDDIDPDVASSGALEPWTREWRDYCSDRYATFNPQNGTYKGYDGKAHFCTAG